MHATMIRDDNFVILDGRGLNVDLSDLPAEIHAVQWYGDHGHVERQGLMNQDIDSIGDFQVWIDRWKAAAEAVDHPIVVVDLPAMKLSKNAEINADRLAATFSTFTHAGKTFACDQLSRSDIDGINGYVALYGALPANWPGAWKATDNSFLVMADIASWKAFYTSMVTAGSANFAHSQALKAALATASTADQVSAITW